MPELPEVETIAHGLDKRVSGDSIDSVWIGSKPEPLKSPAAEIARTLEGTRIERVHRVGKHIVFDLAGGKRAARHQAASHRAAGKENDQRQWIVHLGMTGRLLVATPDSEQAAHTHLVAKLASGRELRFVDPRRFGRLEVRHSPFAGPGTEPLNIGLADFIQLFHGRTSPVKGALLNQKLLHGVGNIYADESLFRAGVRPRRPAGKLTRQEYTKLHAALQEVLHEAIAAGGSSISDYVDAEGEEGFFQLQHRAYGRGGQPCLVCKTPIKKIVVAGRGTHYCSKCQR